MVHLCSQSESVRQQEHLCILAAFKHGEVAAKEQFSLHFCPIKASVMTLLLKQPWLSGGLRLESCDARSPRCCRSSGYLLAMGVIAFPDCTPGRQQVRQYVWLLLATTLLSVKKNLQK